MGLKAIISTYLHQIKAHRDECHSEKKVNGTEDERHVLEFIALCFRVEFELQKDKRMREEATSGKAVS